MKSEILFYLIISNAFSVGTTGANSGTDSIRRFSQMLNDIEQIATKLTEVLKTYKMEDAINAIKTFSKSIGVVVPFVSLLGDGISLIQSFNERNDFKEINQKLDRISRMLSEISDSFSEKLFTGFASNKLKDEIQKIDNLNRAFIRFLSSPNEVSHNEFLGRCEADNIIDFFNYLNNELSQADYNKHFKQAVIGDYDMANTIRWSVRTMTSTAQGIVLYPMCVALKYNHSTGSIEHTDNVIKKELTPVKTALSKFLEEAVQKVKEDFWKEKAIEEIKNIGQSAKSNREWVDITYQHLSKKYPWRRWMAASWNYQGSLDTADSYAYNLIATKYLVLELKSRMAMVAYTEKIQSGSQEHLESCMSLHKGDKFCYGSQSKADQIRDMLVTCFITRGYRAILVVIENQGLQYRIDERSSAVSSVMTKCTVGLFFSKWTEFDLIILS